MKTTSLKNLAVLLAVGSLALSASAVLAQDSTATTATAAATQAASQLPYGVSQIMQLEQAKVGDETIIAYVKNSGNSYGLNADQIIYLRQQGVSSAVVNAMLSQPAPGALAANQGPASAPPTTYYGSEPTYAQPVSSPSIVGPAVTAIDPSATSYYYYPTYYQPYYYPAYGYSYGYYPGVSLSFGWGGGFRGGFRGGGGFRGVGGFHGGGFHGGHR